MRALALLPLASLGCVLATPLGELPSDDTGTSTSAGTTTTTVATSVTGPSESEGNETSTTEPPPRPPHAWAMRYDVWLASFDDGSGTSGADSGGGGTGGTGGEPSPDTLVVQVSTGPDDCADPHAVLECGDYWSVTMLVPPELQVPGTYDLFEQLMATAAFTGTFDEGVGCTFGGGTIEGTAELVEVSETQVVVRLSAVTPVDTDADGEHVAPRC